MSCRRGLAQPTGPVIYYPHGSKRNRAVQARLLAWYDREGRKLPFRGTKDPYLIWISETMLQQTQTGTAAGYYLRFIARFPDVQSLAAASQQEVLKLWEGLGYYSRARNLHKAAVIVAGEMNAQMPRTAAALQTLPGIGPYTAAAIASIAYDEPLPAMDGNLTRVISRLYLVEEDVGIPSVKRRLYQLGLGLMPEGRAGDMNQALMDLGATVCLPGTPDCPDCPLQGSCAAYEAGEPERLPLLPLKKPPRVIPLGGRHHHLWGQGAGLPARGGAFARAVCFSFDRASKLSGRRGKGPCGCRQGS